MGLDELAARLDHVAHQRGEDVLRLVHVLDLDRGDLDAPRIGLPVEKTEITYSDRAAAFLFL